MTPREHPREYTKVMRLRRPIPPKSRHQRLLIVAAVVLLGTQLILLVWLCSQPLPDRLERPGQGPAATLNPS